VLFLAKFRILATSAFFFFFCPLLLWGEFLQPGEGKKKKKTKEDAKATKGFFFGGKNGSTLSHYEGKKYEGRHIYLEDSFQQVANNRRITKVFHLSHVTSSEIWLKSS
jgi:hypothetical protein